MDPTVVIFDVKEKEVGNVTAPSLAVENAAAGFPQRKVRPRVSAFKQQKQSQLESKQPPASKSLPSPAAVSSRNGSERAESSFEQAEKTRIDQENRERVHNMSPEEIAAAQEEIFSNLDPSLLQKLLRRANLDESKGLPLFGESEESPLSLPEIKVEDTSAAEPARKANSKSKKSVSFAPVERGSTRHPPSINEDAPPTATPENLVPIVSNDINNPSQDTSTAKQNLDGMHFPQPSIPDLDPSDPNFLESLHDKYFPSLPADPSKLAWMAPLPTADSPADRDSPYYPGQSSLAISQLRFDFRGRLLPPRVARQIPTSKGLHHHGEAPEAAGYTVLELARLARSAVPSQRCVAFQTLGRILYKLGKGEWGGPNDELPVGLWRCFSEGRVLETLHEAAGVEEGRGHQGSRVYAIEAIWLFEKGGWKERWTGR